MLLVSVNNNHNWRVWASFNDPEKRAPSHYNIIAAETHNMRTRLSTVKGFLLFLLAGLLQIKGNNEENGRSRDVFMSVDYSMTRCVSGLSCWGWHQDTCRIIISIVYGSYINMFISLWLCPSICRKPWDMVILFVTRSNCVFLQLISNIFRVFHISHLLNRDTFSPVIVQQTTLN